MPEREKTAFWTAVGFAWQFGYTIAVPLIVLTLVGRLLDKRLGTHPWLLITGVILSMILSSVALVRKANQLMRDANSAANSDHHGNLPRR